MSWFGFAVALLVTLLAQTTLHWADWVPPFGLDLMLALCLAVALVAPVHEARLAGWIVGLAVDLMTADGPLGPHAFAFGLTAWLITHLRETLNRYVWWGRLLIAAGAALPGQALLLVHLHAIQGGHIRSLGSAVGALILLSATAALLAAIVTALPRFTVRRRGYQAAGWRRA